MFISIGKIDIIYYLFLFYFILKMSVLTRTNYFLTHILPWGALVLFVIVSCIMSYHYRNYLKEKKKQTPLTENLTDNTTSSIQYV